MCRSGRDEKRICIPNKTIKRWIKLLYIVFWASSFTKKAEQRNKDEGKNQRRRMRSEAKVRQDLSLNKWGQDHMSFDSRMGISLDFPPPKCTPTTLFQANNEGPGMPQSYRNNWTVTDNQS